MTAWQKEEIEVGCGEKVSARMPVIVSASRSTDIPAFYSDWFVEHNRCVDDRLIAEINSKVSLASAMSNWKRHQDNPRAETVAGG